MRTHSAPAETSRDCGRKENSDRPPLICRLVHRVGTAGDSAAMESIFRYLKYNVLDRRSWTTREELRISTLTWTERTCHRTGDVGRSRAGDRPL